jgi:hypothetical protein
LYSGNFSTSASFTLGKTVVKIIFRTGLEGFDKETVKARREGTRLKPAIPVTSAVFDSSSIPIFLGGAELFLIGSYGGDEDADRYILVAWVNGASQFNR